MPKNSKRKAVPKKSTGKAAPKKSMGKKEKKMNKVHIYTALKAAFVTHFCNYYEYVSKLNICVYNCSKRRGGKVPGLPSGMLLYRTCQRLKTTLIHLLKRRWKRKKQQPVRKSSL